MAPAVATGSGTPADWALASSSSLQLDHATSRALKERDFSLGFNGGTSSPGGSACFERPGSDKPSSAAAAGAWETTARSGLPISYGISFDTTPHEALPVGTLPNPSSLNLAGQSLFSSAGRFVNTEPNYNRQFNISRSSNEDQFISFYGQRLAPRRDHDDAARASFVSFVGAEVQAQARLQLQASREVEEEAAAGAAASTSVPHSINASSLQQLAIRRVGSAGDIEANKGGAVSIVSPTADGVQHQWPVNILSRAKSSHSEQRAEREAGRGTDEGNAENAINIVDMELLSTRGVAEEQAAQHQAQQVSMIQLQQHQRGLQVEPILMRQRSSSGNTIACQDCGNQAKKDCVHSRCRTCCKSRGYECATHVRSTWVPAAKRRERQQAELAAMVSGQPVPKSKRARTLALAGAAAHLAQHHHHHPAASYTSASTGTPPRTTSEFNAALLPISHQQDTLFRAVLPPEIKAQAVFQCVRVAGVTDGQEEYAYRTVVRIGGRVFKGLLHDQGVSDRGNVPSSSVAELQLGGRSAPISSALIDLAGIYGTPGNTLLGKETMPGPF